METIAWFFMLFGFYLFCLWLLDSLEPQQKHKPDLQKFPFAKQRVKGPFPPNK